jgi:hypothetical protein
VPVLKVKKEKKKSDTGGGSQQNSFGAELQIWSSLGASSCKVLHALLYKQKSKQDGFLVNACK